MFLCITERGTSGAQWILVMGQRARWSAVAVTVWALREGEAFVFDFLTWKTINLFVHGQLHVLRDSFVFGGARIIIMLHSTWDAPSQWKRDRDQHAWHDTLKVGYFFERNNSREWIWHVLLPAEDSGSKLYHFKPNHKDSFECITGETSWGRNSARWAGTIASFFQSDDDKGLLVQALGDQRWH